MKGLVVVEATALEAIIDRLDRLQQAVDKLSEQADADDIIGPEEAAELLGLKAVNSLYRLCRQGEIPHMMQGRHYRFSRGELLAHMKGGAK